MGDVLIRDLDDRVVESWKARAARRGRSLQQELKAHVTAHAAPTREERLRSIEDFTAEWGRIEPVAAPEDMIREDREAR